MAMVMTKSKAFSFDRVRFPDTRRIKTKAAYAAGAMISTRSTPDQPSNSASGSGLDCIRWQRRRPMGVAS